jgi:hypothetical protein
MPSARFSRPGRRVLPVAWPLPVDRERPPRPGRRRRPPPAARPVLSDRPSPVPPPARPDAPPRRRPSSPVPLLREPRPPVREPRPPEGEPSPLLREPRRPRPGIRPSSPRAPPVLPPRPNRPLPPARLPPSPRSRPRRPPPARPAPRPPPSDRSRLRAPAPRPDSPESRPARPTPCWPAAVPERVARPIRMRRRSSTRPRTATATRWNSSHRRPACCRWDSAAYSASSTTAIARSVTARAGLCWARRWCQGGPVRCVGGWAAARRGVAVAALALGLPGPGCVSSAGREAARRRAAGVGRSVSVRWSTAGPPGVRCRVSGAGGWAVATGVLVVFLLVT